MSPLALFLLGCTAVYLGTVDAAFGMLMRLSLRLMTVRDGGSSRLERYLDDPLELFVPVRLLLGLVTVVAVVLMARMIGATEPHHFGLIVLSAVAFIVVCQHVIPLLIVRRNPEGVLEVLLPSFDVVKKLVRPFALPIASLVGTRRDRPASEPGEESAGGPAAAEPSVEEAGSSGALEQDGRRLLQSIVEFGDTLVREVMTPRPDIAAIEASASIDRLRVLLREQGYSRIPVYRDSLDNILGFVFIKDFIQLPPDTPGTTPIATVMRPAYFVPETKPVADLLKDFQREQAQIAIVVDEYGGTAGLVTVEDLLEEIVGEIRDEYDRETEPVIDEGEGAFLFSGKANVDLVNERLGVAIEPEGFDTVGGYLLARLGRVPAVGESFDVDGLAVDVLEAERRRVNRVRIRRKATEEPLGGPQ